MQTLAQNRSYPKTIVNIWQQNSPRKQKSGHSSSTIVYCFLQIPEDPRYNIRLQESPCPDNYIPGTGRISDSRIIYPTALSYVREISWIRQVSQNSRLFVQFSIYSCENSICVPNHFAVGHILRHQKYIQYNGSNPTSKGKITTCAQLLISKNIKWLNFSTVFQTYGIMY